MSYILDALKESDQQRKQVTPPPIARTPAPSTRPARGAGRRVLWLLLLVLVLAGALLWQSGWLQPGVISRSASDSTTAPVSAPPEPVRLDAVTPTVTVQAPSQVSETRDRLSDDALMGVKLVVEPRPEAPAVRRSAAEEARAPAPTRAASPTNAAAPWVADTPVEPEPTQDPYADLPYLRQLPADVQRELPPLKFSVHIYSEQRSGRMVRLNDRMIREGQRIAPSLQLEAIIPRGVVLSYKEHRFKVPTI